MITGPTKGDHILDLVLTNIEPEEMVTSVCPPLESDDRTKKSDHKGRYLEH